MNNQITSASELAAKIEAKRYDFFTFPVLDITIKYRRPDLLKLSFNKALPTFIADTVIDSYKEAISGTDMREYQKAKAEEGVKANEDVIKDLSTKGYNLLTELCVSHTIINGLSDLDNGVISWNDIPEEDAIAFLMNLINRASVSQTKTGGEVTSEDVINFPDGKRKSKRSSAGTNG